MNTDRSLKLTAFFRLTAVAAILLTATMLLNAQPSGGPYGPVKQSWPLHHTGDTCRTGNLILNQGITIQPYGDE